MREYCSAALRSMLTSLYRNCVRYISQVIVSDILTELLPVVQ